MIKIEASKLYEILDFLKLTVSSRDFRDVKSRYFFLDDYVYSYGSRMAIRYPFKTGGERFVVDGSKLFGIVSHIKNDNVKLKVSDSSIIITSGNIKAKLKLGDIEDSLIDEILNIPFPTKWVKILDPEGFVWSLDVCSRSASRDEGHAYMSCVYVDGDVVVAGDQMRLSRCVLDKPFKEKFLMSYVSAAQFSNYNLVGYQAKKNHLFFKSENGVELCTIRSIAEYPDLSKLFKKKKHIVDLPEDFESMVDVAEEIVKEAISIDRRIVFEIGDGKFVCKGITIDGGEWCLKEVDLDVDFPVKKFSIKPVTFQEIVDTCDKISFDDRFAAFEGENFKHLVLLFANDEENEEVE